MTNAKTVTSQFLVAVSTIQQVFDAETIDNHKDKMLAEFPNGRSVVQVLVGGMSGSESLVCVETVDEIEALLKAAVA